MPSLSDIKTTNQITKAAKLLYIQVLDHIILIRKLAKDGNYKMSLLIALGCFTGLRIFDILI